MAAKDEFWAVRGKAIQSYAGLEQALARLFSALAGTTQEIGGAIFFRIASADARRNLIGKLFQIKFRDQYHLFRNSLIKQLRPIDNERNEIVHWNVVNNVAADDAGKTTSKLALMPPSTFPSPNSVSKDTDGMKAFANKCGFYTSLVSMFPVIAMEGFAATPISEADMRPWLNAYSRPIEYPPPVGHVLDRYERSDS
ncbi:hypothetical protein [Bradyrhizobium erythrophlei]|uniref:hypothetical protein n=1 Tax=Bradyrhizobium erythrophlei TaxID=1437360 RepID=UPI0012AC1016|nr:hypothetical protein [Bradyrhizobium erythrophlei]